MLKDLYNRAQDLVIPALLSDLFFTHPPSRIALGCLRLASIENSWENNFYEYLRSRASYITVPLDLITEDLITVTSEIKAVMGEKCEKSTAAKIDLKLKTCLNPEFDESSHL